MHTSSIYQITSKLKILVFINSCMQPIIIVGSTILVNHLVPSFHAPKVHLSCFPHLLLPGAPGTGGSSLFTLQQQSTKVWYPEAHAMKWLSILKYASYNFAVLWQISLLSSLFYEQCIFFFVQRKFLWKHGQIQNYITKVCFYCTADTLFWGCTETCQCTKTCHLGIQSILDWIYRKPR